MKFIASGPSQKLTLAKGPEKRAKTGFLEGTRDFYDLIIIGAGLSGSVFAEQASKRGFLTSLVLDKRDHIGGNCFDFINEKGIRVSLDIDQFRNNLLGLWASSHSAAQQPQDLFSAFAIIFSLDVAEIY